MNSPHHKMISTPRSRPHFTLEYTLAFTQGKIKIGRWHTYQRSVVLAHSVHGGQGPCLSSQMWAGVLAPLLSGVIRIRLGDCQARMPPHFARGIILLLIRVQLISLFATPNSHGVQRKIRVAPIIRTVFCKFCYTCHSRTSQNTGSLKALKNKQPPTFNITTNIFATESF